MANSIANPFTPLYGQQPAFMAGRTELLAQMRKAFDRGRGDPNLSTIISGARGTGKTALLSCIAGEASSLGWISVNVVSLPGMLADIYIRAKRHADELTDSGSKAHITGFEIGSALSLDWELEQPQTNWRNEMDQLFARLEEKDIGLLITVDEVDPSLDELVQLVSTYQLFLGEGKKVALIMAGLPSNVYSLLSGKSTSFTRRARLQHLGRLDDGDASEAFEKTLGCAGIEIAAEALELATSCIDGYPYMLQLVGYWSLESLDGSGKMTVENVKAGCAQAAKDMRQGVLNSTYRELSEGDIAFLEAMLADEDASRMSDIATRMGVSASYASQYRLRLIQQGVIGERGRGKVGFDIPLMRQYVDENRLLEELPLSHTLTVKDPASWTKAGKVLDEIGYLNED